ncbi:MAG TPA: radical SAM protein [Gemmatimonadaceae bacterium]|jgi:DNA repair photolyase|nr:radical SAM protein [Gemmatimonadaceae bacterium]
MQLQPEPVPLLFPDLARPRALPVIGAQKDITYHDTIARSILNGPEITKMGFWSINPYIGCAFGCAYCYARYTHRYVMERAVTAETLDDATQRDVERIPPWLAFERHIVVKRNAATVLSRTLRHGSDKHRRLIEGETIVIGTATDPYQPAERRFRVTRGILEVLAEHPGLDVVVITKSPLITRDIDVLVRLMRHSTVSIHLSLITLDRQLARRIEPRAPTPDSRVRALERLHEAGIEVGINCMPVLPGITDNPRDLEALVRRVAQAGASSVGACALRLRHEARLRYLPFIAQEFPHLAERYRGAYARSHHVSERYREGLSRFMKRLCAKYGIDGGYPDEEEDDTDSPALLTDTQLELALAR